jgi:hypothetical protein
MLFFTALRRKWWHVHVPRTGWRKTEFFTSLLRLPETAVPKPTAPVGLSASAQ